MTKLTQLSNRMDVLERTQKPARRTIIIDQTPAGYASCGFSSPEVDQLEAILKTRFPATDYAFILGDVPDNVQ